MAKMVPLDRKMAALSDGLRVVRDRITILTVALLEEGISQRSYRQLQCLFEELGKMPPLPYVEDDGEVVRMSKKEMIA